MGSAEHLAVLGQAFAASAPCGNVVRVHFGELPYLAFIGSMADCAERTIRCAIGFGSCGLLGVDGLLGRFVEHPYIQELRILKAAENVFEDAATVLDVRVGIKPLDLGRNFGRII